MSHESSVSKHTLFTILLAYFIAQKLNIKRKIITCNFFFLTIRNYLDRLAEEVNDKLQENGQVTISELCKTYDLPGNFLTQVFFLNSIISFQINKEF